jgi:SAM-dependent methyltransferase
MRDTDEDWLHYGTFEPYYGVLTHDRFLRANLTSEALEEFWQAGRDDVRSIWSQLTRLFGERRPELALDFGCGVGRLTRAMSEISARAVGVDISPEMIAEGRAHAPANVELTTELPAGPFDWINSFIVFQHIPPARGYDLFASLLNRAAASAFVSVHLTFFKDARGLNDHGIDEMRFATWDGEVIRPVIRNERDRKMMMYDYDLNRIFGMLIDHRFTDIHLSHTDHAGVHGAIIYAAR